MMTREQLLAIAQRHREDHTSNLSNHPRGLTMLQDAIGDRGALLEFVADIAQSEMGQPLRSALDDMGLKRPALPNLNKARPAAAQVAGEAEQVTVSDEPIKFPSPSAEFGKVTAIWIAEGGEATMKKMVIAVACIGLSQRRYGEVFMSYLQCRFSDWRIYPLIITLSFIGFVALAAGVFLAIDYLNEKFGG